MIMFCLNKDKKLLHVFYNENFKDILYIKSFAVYTLSIIKKARLELYCDTDDTRTRFILYLPPSNVKTSDSISIQYIYMERMITCIEESGYKLEQDFKRVVIHDGQK